MRPGKHGQGVKGSTVRYHHPITLGRRRRGTVTTRQARPRWPLDLARNIGPCQCLICQPAAAAAIIAPADLPLLTHDHAPCLARPGRRSPSGSTGLGTPSAAQLNPQQTANRFAISQEATFWPFWHKVIAMRRRRAWRSSSSSGSDPRPPTGLSTMLESSRASKAGCSLVTRWAIK